MQVRRSNSRNFYASPDVAACSDLASAGVADLLAERRRESRDRQSTSGSGGDLIALTPGTPPVGAQADGGTMSTVTLLEQVMKLHLKQQLQFIDQKLGSFEDAVVSQLRGVVEELSSQVRVLENSTATRRGTLSRGRSSTGLLSRGSLLHAPAQPNASDLDQKPFWTSKERIDTETLTSKEHGCLNGAITETNGGPTFILPDPGGFGEPPAASEAPSEQMVQPKQRSERTVEEDRKQSSASSWSVPSAMMEKIMFLMGKARPRSPLTIKAWQFLDDPDLATGGSFFKWFMAALTVFSAFIPVYMTVPSNSALTRVYSANLEIVLDGICTLELLVRFWVCPNRCAFFVNHYNHIDVVAGPLSLLVRALHVGLTDVREADSTAIFLVCVLPVLRLARLLRRSEKFHLLYKAMVMSLEALPVLLFTLAIIVLIFASLLYIVEPRDNVDSMPRAIWVSISVVGTIGFSDTMPVTPEGQMAIAVLIVISSLYMAIPIGVVGTIFSQVWEQRDRILLAQFLRKRLLDVGYKAKDVPAIFLTFDTDGDGELTLAEFTSMMTRMQIELSGARIVQLFQAFDTDASGSIDDREFVRTLFPNAYTEIYCQIDEDEEAG